MSRTLHMARDMRSKRFEQLVELFVQNQPKWFQKINPFQVKSDYIPNLIHYPPDTSNRMEETWILIPVELWKTQTTYNIHINEETACIILYLYDTYQPSKYSQRFCEDEFGILYNLCIDPGLNFQSIIQQKILYIVTPLNIYAKPTQFIYFFEKNTAHSRGLLEWSNTRHKVKYIIDPPIANDLHKLPWFTTIILHEYYNDYYKLYGTYQHIHNLKSVCIPPCEGITNQFYTDDQLQIYYRSADILILDYITCSCSIFLKHKDGNNNIVYQ
jgi:hypothetical protein